MFEDTLDSDTSNRHDTLAYGRGSDIQHETSLDTIVGQQMHMETAFPQCYRWYIHKMIFDLDERAIDVLCHSYMVFKSIFETIDRGALFICALEPTAEHRVNMASTRIPSAEP